VIIILISLVLLLSSPASARREGAGDRGAAAGAFHRYTGLFRGRGQGRPRALQGLRVADVVDGLDAVGLVDTGTMDPDIHALWRDTANFTHRSPASPSRPATCRRSGPRPAS